MAMLKTRAIEGQENLDLCVKKNAILVWLSLVNDMPHRVGNKVTSKGARFPACWLCQRIPTSSEG
ncbi:hypothetical protein FTN76_04360 [Chlamydia trachomatis]|uniref:Uncharacterized protein n=1 Tax=Chlamydia trachomatis serovar A (strain A2497) TaxID=580047 RepID=G4NMK0_CHLT4|nr:hypothetical protein E150_02960 [Chlamydia trachomatis E/150]ADH18268.1 hypothetical protein G9768_02945 [Chlamydia trachomatis G/9768]ADH19192.1 hypothetical protein G11222_02955 [Chlamydia trachomatis G/11222]ADH21039.1 hypothetical protein E11023_02945 [Chlamydia trachomatis E/11023]ADH97213.1 hypothetical protein CTG9301_02955 [Chlamydia trachomatis G/9301]AEJ77652.1 hypothetical protein CTL2C_733 [Chlamydia trachomatis L2c]AEP35428.1 hypothetical protein CTO_0985 [Chlamydia trachomati